LYSIKQKDTFFLPVCTMTAIVQLALAQFLSPEGYKADQSDGKFKGSYCLLQLGRWDGGSKGCFPA
jgi:hypothetical protein